MGFNAAWVPTPAQPAPDARHVLQRAEARGESLCFFYAKRIPYAEEDGRRVIVGVGSVTDNRVSHARTARALPIPRPADLGSSSSFDFAGFHDGFLLPYHELIDLADRDESVDISSAFAYAPDEAWDKL